MSRSDLRLDRDNQCLLRAGARIPLTPKAFAVLEELRKSAGRLVMKNELLESVWPDTFVGDAVLTVTIKQLRDLLGDDARHPRVIETVHRRGYRLIAELPLLDEPVRQAPAAPALVEPAPARLAGRHDALALLHRHWLLANEARRQLVFVSGEPGIGKTAVADAFTEQMHAIASGAVIGRGQCLEEYGTAEAYLPVLEALEEILRADAQGVFTQQLRRSAPTWFAQFPWLLTDDDAARMQRELQGATRERMLRELATTLELVAARTPIVLVLEDLHWCDPSTVSLLTFLAQRRQPARLLVIATYRPVDLIVGGHPLKEAKQRLQVARQCTEIALDHLDVGAVGEIVRQRLDGGADDETVDLLLRHSNGNPLFLHNLLDHLSEFQLLQRRDGLWHAPPDVVRDQVPAGLRQVIEHGLERLAPEELQVLEAASVAGFEFATDAAAAGGAATAADVADICERLARRGDLLRQAGTRFADDARVSGVYAFVHALIQNVLYQRIAPARRVDMHRRLAVWGEANGAGVGELAHHYAQAGPGEMAHKAIAFARQAAQRARAVFAYDEAAHHYEAALAAADKVHPPQPRLRAELLVELGTAQQRAGRVVTAEASFLAAVDIARACDDPASFARAAMGVGYGYQRLGRQEQQLRRLLEESLQRLPEGDHPLRALAMSHLEYCVAGDPEHLRRHPTMATDAEAMARRLDDIDVTPEVMMHLRWVFRGPRDRSGWSEDVATIDRVLARTHSMEQVLVMRCLKIDALLELGDAEAARAALDDFILATDEARLPWFVWLAAGFDHKLTLLRGDFDAAERLAQVTLDAGRATEHPNVNVLFAGQTALRIVMQGRLHELEPVVRAGLDDNPNVHTWRAVLAFLAAELGQLDEARRHFAPIVADLERLPHDTAWFVMMSFVCVACHRLGDRPAAAKIQAILGSCDGGFNGFSGCLICAGHIGRYRALLAATLDDREAATHHFDMALQRNQELGALPWVALTAHDYAGFLEQERGRGAKAKAARLHQQAAELARSLGMTAWLDLWNR